MSTLAELRAEPPAERPERSVTVCVRPDLVAKVQRLTEQLADLPPVPKPVTDEEGERDSRPKRQGESQDPRAVEIQGQLERALAAMAEAEGELRLRAISDGEWRQWVDAHPPREKGKPGHQRDQEVTQGYCNADHLIEDLGRYAYAWNGEPLVGDDWKQHLAPRLGSPDLKEAARAVVGMHESRLDFRRWRSSLSASLRKWNASEQPETSASVPPSSTGESSPSTTSTSTPPAT